jgi:hypothetical protein
VLVEEEFEEVGGDEVGGDEVGGEEVGGDEVGGEEVGGDEVGGEEVGGDEVGGEEEGGEGVGGEGGVEVDRRGRTERAMSNEGTVVTLEKTVALATAIRRNERAARIRIVLLIGWEQVLG